MAPGSDLLRIRTRARAAPTKTYTADDPANGLRMISENGDRNRSQGLVSAQWDAVAGPGELRLRATGCTETARRTWKVSTTTTHSASSTPPNDYSGRSTRPPRPSRSCKLRVDLRRVAADREDTKAARQLDLASVAADNLPPWRGISARTPMSRGDNFNAAEFAADLYTVAQAEASEYSDPVQFFERTYRLFTGLRDLIDRNVRRLSAT